MAFTDFQDQEQAIALLQRSLERGRLGHAYLFTGPNQDRLELAARNLTKTLNCQAPPALGPHGTALDACDHCLNCQKIDAFNHPDVHWVRPESKSRVIKIDQMREVMQTANLKPTQGTWKVIVLVAADRLNEQAANAFLKTLEEPPGDTVFILLSTDPQRLLETILSRCLRLNFSGELGPGDQGIPEAWLADFSRLAAVGTRSLLSRYRLLSVLLNRLNEQQEAIAAALTEKSPLHHYDDLDPSLRDKWEEELKAAIEAEYRWQRRQMLGRLQWWFRDVWIGSLRGDPSLLAYPSLVSDTTVVGQRLALADATGNLLQLERTQNLLNTNVQEALALEVGLLNLKL